MQNPVGFIKSWTGFLAFSQTCIHAVGRLETAHSRRGGHLENPPKTMDFRKAAKKNTKGFGDFGCCLRWAMPNRRISVNFGPGFGAIRVAKSGPHSLQRPPLGNIFQKISGSLETQVRFLEPILIFFTFWDFRVRRGESRVRGLGPPSGVRVVVTQCET